MELKFKTCEAIVRGIRVASEPKPITRETSTQTEVSLRHCFDEVVWMPIIQGADTVVESKIDNDKDDEAFESVTMRAERFLPKHLPRPPDVSETVPMRAERALATDVPRPRDASELVPTRPQRTCFVAERATPSR